MGAGAVRVTEQKKVAPNAETVPASDGEGSSFLDFEQQVHLWMRATKTDPANRAPFLAMHMHSAPRQVCPSAGGGRLDKQDGAARFLEVLRNCLAPEAADAMYQQVAPLT